MKNDLPPRRLIPRWRLVSSTLRQSEAMPSEKKKTRAASRPDPTQEIEETVGAWDIDPSPGTLSDALALSVIPEAASAVVRIAKEGLRIRDRLSPAVLQLAESLALDQLRADRDATEEEAATVDERVRQLRHLLRIAPANSIALLDLAQAQLVAGKERAAERLLKSALQTMPNDRIVLRTLARFYVHIGQPDKAHALIASHPRSATDPWLMASEIALSEVADTSSPLVNKGQRLLKTNAFADSHVTELAGAIASLELSHGKIKFARDLYRIALKQPNDNVLAQALMNQEWLGIAVSSAQIESQRTSASEAKLLNAWMQFDHANAETHAIAWAKEEPFSSRPIQFTSFIQIARGDYEGALKQTASGLLSNPRDGGLMANRAFTLAAVGRTADAEALLKKQQKLHDAKFRPQYSATLGFIELQRGNWAIADTFYEAALAQFIERDDRQGIGLCLAFYARAARDYGHPEATEIVQRAISAQKQNATIDSVLVLHMSGLLEAPVLDQQGARLRHATSWVYDAETHTLTDSGVVARPGMPLIVPKAQR